VRQLEARIGALERELRAVADADPVALDCGKFLTALVGTVGHINAFRQFASWLGLTPREYSSGARRRLGGISKRGDVYPSMLHARRSGSPPRRIVGRPPSGLAPPRARHQRSSSTMKLHVTSAPAPASDVDFALVTSISNADSTESYARTLRLRTSEPIAAMLLSNPLLAHGAEIRSSKSVANPAANDKPRGDCAEQRNSNPSH
jgi:hypothetical protein